MVRDRLFRWLVTNFCTAVSPELPTLRGRGFKQPMCVSHLLSALSMLLNAGWPCHWSLWSLLQELTASFFRIFKTLIIQKTKLKTQTQQLNAFFLLGKAQCSVEDYPEQRHLPPPPPTFLFSQRKSILMHLRSHWTYFMLKGGKPRT